MNSYSLIGRLCLLAGAVSLAACSQSTINEPASETSADKPLNIVWIMADDMGYGDLGVYGQQKIQTPNLDEMAQQGMKFTDFYAGTTVCAPSRSVLMTGLHMGHTPVRGNADKTIQTLVPDDFTVAELLQDAGYQTALIGKWGLGDDGNTGLPNDQGFDYFFGYLNQVHAHNHYPDFLWRNKEKVPLPNVVEPAPFGYMSFHGGVVRPENRKVNSSDLFYQESVEFIQNAGEKPFFLYVSLTSPHANNEAEKVDWAHGMEIDDYGQYADLDWPEPAKGYAAMVSRIDEGVGQILDTLEQQGLAENTLVIFTSDNGPHEEGGNDPYFFNSSGPFSGTKRALTDGGIRMPFIAWGPGIVPAGKVSDHIGYFGDLMATAAEAAGVEAPANLDSVSFLPVVTGQEEAQQQHEMLYFEFYEMGGIQAVRYGDYKAIRTPFHTGPIQLFNVVDDPKEQLDIAGQNPEIVARIATFMDKAHVPDPRWTPSAGAAGRD
ncbi:N-acetylgalactosamine-6-sulfatase [Alteromonas aestuariivivens]|uniref:N-acetylgalactosamine-6-sulfatase n=1 Tax=Alteromonas aestuariivivens TaxID=1938339 RepID=A0A3D8MF29_9ALTE|nr:arylsulfatase [Alteromonas aestuariivivens]RDV29362.1 N-acetylgalactosamine-6-sulfatase [Alteromonas aestuariivivens]